MAKRKKTPTENIYIYPVTPLLLSTKDAEFLNRMKAIADKAEERAKGGGNGNAYYHVAALRRLDKLSGAQPQHLKYWDVVRPELAGRYPTGTHAVYLALARVRKRVAMYKAMKKEADNV